MQVDEILDEAMWLGAIRERASAELVVGATLEALARLLTPAEAARLAEGLPPQLAAKLQRPDGGGAQTGDAGAQNPHALYRRVASLEEISLGLAVEHVRAAAEALARALDSERRVVLAQRLPPEWAALFTWRERAPELDGAAPTGARDEHTLAGGRPGSAHPLSEARPPAGQAGSVVASVNPHADRKLSSAAPAESVDPMSTARPGAEHPLSEARGDRSRR